MRITVTIKGGPDTIAKLHRLGDQLNDFSDAMRTIGQSVGNYYASTGFTDQGRPYGEDWASLSPRYLKRKELKHPGAPMLVASGKMQRSFFFKPGPQGVIIDNSTPYFKYHQSTANRSKIPRRATMGINGGIRSTIGTIIEKDIRSKIDGVRL